jgi:transcription antitermination factor NusG
MELTKGTPVIILRGPYADDDGTVSSMSNADGYVNVHFPQYGRYGRIVEMPINNVKVTEDNPS